MTAPTKHDSTTDYHTITGVRISMAHLTELEARFLEQVSKKYNSKQDWTRFASWWNARFDASQLTPSSATYRICQDLEARLGIEQGKLAPPDYRDHLVELIDSQFESRHEFCNKTGIDAGQLSRVVAGRSDLSMKVLQEALQALGAKLVIQNERDARSMTSVDRALDSISTALMNRGDSAQSTRVPVRVTGAPGRDIENSPILQ